MNDKLQKVLLSGASPEIKSAAAYAFAGRSGKAFEEFKESLKSETYAADEEETKIVQEALHKYCGYAEYHMEELLTAWDDYEKHAAHAFVDLPKGPSGMSEAARRLYTAIWNINRRPGSKTRNVGIDIDDLNHVTSGELDVIENFANQMNDLIDDDAQALTDLAELLETIRVMKLNRRRFANIE